jgi:23S rRNA (cytosine1962-C5)-methyltransferase
MPRASRPTGRSAHSDTFKDVFDRACSRRHRLTASRETTAYRLFDGSGDGLAGISVDRYGPAAVLGVYEDSGWQDAAITDAAETILAALGPSGLEAVYVKRFSRDRSRLGGRAPAESTSPTPRAGKPQPEALIITEHGVRYEVRLHDGFSTGLFLEHRAHRRVLAERGITRALNLFAYTCAFSVPLAASGAHVTNVDVSARYLDWGRRNHALNGLDASPVRYARMDSMAYLTYAARHPEERFDLVILDPPTFSAGDRRRGVKPWKATTGYPTLLQSAARVLMPNGCIFAATNTRELAEGSALRAIVETSLGAVRWQPLPSWPDDVREQGRVAAVLFTLR